MLASWEVTAGLAERQTTAGFLVSVSCGQTTEDWDKLRYPVHFEYGTYLYLSPE